MMDNMSFRLEVPYRKSPASQVTVEDKTASLDLLLVSSGGVFYTFYSTWLNTKRYIAKRQHIASEK